MKQDLTKLSLHLSGYEICIQTFGELQTWKYWLGGKSVEFLIKKFMTNLIGITIPWHNRIEFADLIFKNVFFSTYFESTVEERLDPNRLDSERT